MKTKFTLFLSWFFLITVISGQSAMFPTDNAEWKYYFRFAGENSYGASQEITGDSLFESELYHMVSSSSNPEGHDSGMFREEDKRVYFIPKDSIDEVLLYDFNLEIGDTFLLDPFLILDPQIEYDIALGVDSIVTDDGVSRKRICFDQGGCWIEGVGATYGSFTLPWHFISLSGDNYLYCFTKDSVDVFEKIFSIQVGDYEFEEVGCNGVISSTKNLIHNNAITISPNPFTDRIAVSVEDGQVVESLSLYNISSELIARREHTQTLNLGGLISPGLYSLVIEIDGKTYFEKIVKL